MDAHNRKRSGLIKQDHGERPSVIAVTLLVRKILARTLISTSFTITRMSTTLDTTTSGGSANADHQASNKPDRPMASSTENETSIDDKWNNEIWRKKWWPVLLVHLRLYWPKVSGSQTCIRTLRNKYPNMSDILISMGQMRQVIMKLRLPVWPIPDDIPEGSSDGVKVIWKNRLTEYVKRELVLAENVKTMYSFIWGQYTDVMRQKIASHSDYETTEDVTDAIGLLKTIKSIMFNFQGQIYCPQALRDAKRRFYNLSQNRHMTCQAYLENSVEVIKHCGGDLGIDHGLIDATFATAIPTVARDTAAPQTLKAAQKYVREQYLACAFLLGSDRKWYGKLLENLENECTQKTDKWPKTITDAYSLLLNWKQDPRHLLRVVGVSSDSVALTNVREKATGERVTTPATTAGNEKEKVWVQPPPIHTIKAKCY